MFSGQLFLRRERLKEAEEIGQVGDYGFRPSGRGLG